MGTDIQYKDCGAKMKKALVLGAGGFIGSHLVKKLVEQGYWVRGVDLKAPDHWNTYADHFVIGDLRDPYVVSNVIDRKFDEVYQLAADMGGAGYINTGANDADVMSNSILINVNVLKRAHEVGIKSIFFSSTACVYPEYNQMDPDKINCREDTVYPAAPDTEYGWEKLFSERLYLAYNKNYGMTNKIARYHNVYGPYGTWDGGKEKAPAAICRKVAKATDEIEIWGNGEQHRSFLYIDEAIKATIDFYRQDKYFEPINIGSERNVSINELVDIVCNIAGKTLIKKHIPGPLGVHARTSHNALIKSVLGYAPDENLEYGLSETYKWIQGEIK
jgi:nucleoside-diphosphate-sugar epimerase